MSAARRAATYLAIRSEPSLSATASDPSALDEYCAAGLLVDRLGISDASLAAASADADAVTASIARALLAARTTLRIALEGADSSQGAVDLYGRPLPAAAADDKRPPPRLVAKSLAEAFLAARDHGIRALEMPRAALSALGSGNPSLLFLRAAFSKDDELLLRAMSADFDVAELRMAQRLAAGRPLRKALPITGAAFRGAEAREKALAWSARLRASRQAGRKKRGALRAAIDAAALDDTLLIAAASAADRVWDGVEKPPPVTVRMHLLCDALESSDLDSLHVLPIGTDVGVDLHGRPIGPDITVRFAGSSGVGMIEALFAALEREMPKDNVVTIDMPVHRAIAQWLEAWVDHKGRPLQGVSPYVWPMAETAQPVVAPSMTFSASRLNLHAKCPRRWFYEYLCAAVEERSTANAVYGKVFHAALEALHREVRVPSQWRPAEVVDKLCGLLDAAFGQAHREFGSQLEYEVLRQRGRRVARHYVRWLYEEAADAPLEIVEIESRQQLLLGSHRFVGYIDRIDRPVDGGPITIFDYKTGRIEDDPDEYLRQIREGEEAQLALYFAMRRAQGDRIARIALVSIRDTRDKAWVLALDIADAAGGHVMPRIDRPGVVRATCTVEDLERSLERLSARCDVLTGQGVAHFDVGSDPPCSYCAYAAACRERPADGERIFAR